jgi:hypothetical protein
MAPAQAEARPAAGGDGGSTFARALASGATRQRDTALTALSRWLASRPSVEEAEMLKLWKGLFYAMWHADKAPVQARGARCSPRKQAARTLALRSRTGAVRARVCVRVPERAPRASRRRRWRSAWRRCWTTASRRCVAVLRCAASVGACALRSLSLQNTAVLPRLRSRNAARPLRAAQVALAYFRACFITLR